MCSVDASIISQFSELYTMLKPQQVKAVSPNNTSLFCYSVLMFNVQLVLFCLGILKPMLSACVTFRLTVLTEGCGLPKESILGY